MRAKHLIGGWERIEPIEKRFSAVSNLDSLYAKRVQVEIEGIDNPVPMVEFVDDEDNVAVFLTVWDEPGDSPLPSGEGFAVVRWEKTQGWDEFSQWVWDLSTFAEDGCVFVNLIRRVPVIVDDDNIDLVDDGDVFVDEVGEAHIVGEDTRSRPQSGWVLAHNGRRSNG